MLPPIKKTLERAVREIPTAVDMDGVRSLSIPIRTQTNESNLGEKVLALHMYESLRSAGVVEGHPPMMNAMDLEASHDKIDLGPNASIMPSHKGVTLTLSYPGEDDPTVRGRLQALVQAETTREEQATGKFSDATMQQFRATLDQLGMTVGDSLKQSGDNHIAFTPRKESGLGPRFRKLAEALSEGTSNIAQQPLKLYSSGRAECYVPIAHMSEETMVAKLTALQETLTAETRAAKAARPPSGAGASVA